MASAKKVHNCSYNVVLTLTPDEAKVLLSVTKCIGGHPQTTKRGVTDRIFKALNDIGIKSYEVDDIIDRGARSIDMINYQE
jgi:hypothetical protein